MDIKSFQLTQLRPTDHQLRSSVRNTLYKQRFFSLSLIFLLNTMMVFNGIKQDGSELKELINGHFLSNFLFGSTLGFLFSPMMSTPLVIGLCWLFFIFFPVRRIAIVLRKTALAFRETLQSFIGLNVHGCRAPPHVSG